MHTKGLIWGPVILGIQLTWLPNLSLLTWLTVAITIDFITGVLKSKVAKKEITSSLYRETIKKIIQYFGCISLCLLVQNISKSEHEYLGYFDDGVISFIIYIEVVSIFENLYEVDSTSLLSKLLIKPALTVLKFGLEKNPIAGADKVIDNNKNSLT